MYFPLELCIGKLLPSAAGIGRGGLHQGAPVVLLRVWPLTVPSIFICAKTSWINTCHTQNVIPPDYSSTRCNACPAVLKTSNFSPLNSKNLLIAFGSLWGFFPVFQTAGFLWVFLVGGFWVFLLFTNHPFVFIGLFLALFPMQEKVSCPVSVPWLYCPLTPHAQLFI